MSDLSDIEHALFIAKSNNEALLTWLRNIDAKDSVRSDGSAIERGIAACARLAKDLRNGSKHIEMPDDFKATGCMCGWSDASPPCSWCIDPENNPDKDES